MFKHPINLDFYLKWEHIRNLESELDSIYMCGSSFNTIARYSLISLLATMLIGCEANQPKLKQSETGFHKTKTTVTTKMESKNESRVEALSSVSFSGDTIRASVISHGCTTPADFQVTHEVVGSMCQVTVIRTKPDMCRRAPFVADIELAWTPPSDCTDMPITIANPMLVMSDSHSLIKRIK